MLEYVSPIQPVVEKDVYFVHLVVIKKNLVIVRHVLITVQVAAQQIVLAADQGTI